MLYIIIIIIIIIIINLFSVSSGYGIVLVSGSTVGPHVSHCVEGSSMTSSQSPSPPHSLTGPQPQESVLPEDIGQRTAMRLIEEIVRVSICIHVRSNFQILKLLSLVKCTMLRCGILNISLSLTLDIYCIRSNFQGFKISCFQ